MSRQLNGKRTSTRMRSDCAPWVRCTSNVCDAWVAAVALGGLPDGIHTTLTDEPAVAWAPLAVHHKQIRCSLNRGDTRGYDWPLRSTATDANEQWGGATSLGPANRFATRSVVTAPLSGPWPAAAPC